MTTQKSYVGAAPALTLQGGITAIATTFVASTGGSAAGYPDGSAGKFVVLLGGAEKVLCSSRSGTTFTVFSRGYDNTTPAAWQAGDPVKHVLDAISLQEASDHVNDKVHTHVYADITNTFTAAQHITGALAATGQATFGTGSLGAAGAYAQVGDTGATALVAAQHGTLADAGLVLRPKGTGTVHVQDGAGTDIVVVSDGSGSDTAITSFVWSLGANRKFVVGAADSGGAGFRVIRVAN